VEDREPDAGPEREVRRADEEGQGQDGQHEAGQRPHARQRPGQRERGQQDAQRLQQRGPVRLAQEPAGEEVRRDVRVLLDAGEHRAHRGHPEVVGPLRGGADEHDPVPERVGRRPAAQEVHRRDVGEGACRTGVVDQHPVPGVEGRDQVADLERPPEVEPQRGRVHAAGDPDRLHGERRVVAAAELEHRRLEPRGPVGVGHHRDVPELPRRGSEGRQGRDRAAGPRRRVLAALLVVPEAHQGRRQGGPRRLGRRARHAPRLGRGLERDRQDDAAARPDRRGQPGIRVARLGQGLELPLHRAPRGGLRRPQGAEARLELPRRAQLAAHLRLAQQDVERDHARARRGRPIDELGEHRARPRPAADLGETPLVDRHDRDRPARVAHAPEREVEVVEAGLERREEGRRQEEERQRGDADRGGDPRGRPTEPWCAHSLSSAAREARRAAAGALYVRA
jgi:hypothetical protein